MEIQKQKLDFILAQRICAELRSGNTEALSELYHKYHLFFSAFTRQRLFMTSDYPVNHFLSDFWVELLNARAICGYEGKASLRTYLTLILSRRIMDANRKIKKAKAARSAFENQGNSIPDNEPLQPSPENDLLKKELQTLMHEALLLLAEISPRDANLIRMHFEGMAYEEMAKKELNGKKISPRKLKKKTNAIKKQFARDKTGSLKKFKTVLGKCLENNALDFSDLLN
jgi:RNA polymerase sigma-70 factor (ECF subfamily)